MKADHNHQLEQVWDFIEHTGENIFLTGRAGTGKTTFLKELRSRSPKRMVVVAPTGVAAINAGGVTMHSFFQLPFGVFIPGTTRKEEEVRRFSRVKIAVIKSIDLLVIDEISMVRADTLDNVDEVLRRFRDRSKPFGGVQLLMIGDLQQLSPVVKDNEWSLLREYYPSPYFFDSRALKQTSYTSIELRRIYRQSDSRFIELLSQVRDNRVDEGLLCALNERFRPDFDPPQSEGYITLTSHNNTARNINERKLSALPAREYRYDADIEGDFPEYLYPVESELRLKEGAQVMFTKNDASPERRYVNGTIGTVVRLGGDYIEVQPSGGGEPIAVEKAEWANSRYTIDPATKEITEQIEGVFTQYPLKTAWAITIHKSQGLTFDRAIIDAADSFSHGQVYVALSRCRTLEGLVLRTPLRRGAIISDGTVDGFTRMVEENQPTAEDLDDCKRRYYRALLEELFGFETLASMFRSTGRFMEEHLWRLYPKMLERWKEAGARLNGEVVPVGIKFRTQIAGLMEGDYAANAFLAERIAKGAVYFTGKCSGLVELLAEAGRASIDNKEIRKRYGELLERFGKELRVKLSTLAVAGEGFSVTGYLKAKAQAVVDGETPVKEKKAKKEKPPKAVKAGGGGAAERIADEGPEDILNPELFAHLRDWRNKLSAERKLPAYTIATQRALTGITNTLPSTAAELLRINGIGRVFVEKYGQTVLSIVEDYRLGKI